MRQNGRVSVAGSMLRAAFALAAWGAVHSVLATRRSKDAARRALGERQRNGLYRLGYNAFAVLSLAGVSVYIHRLPDRTLYRVRGPLRVAFATTRAGTLLFAAWAAWSFTLDGLTGFANAMRWWQGLPVPEEPEAQGPKLLDGGGEHARMDAGGPFARVRHPLNAAGAALMLLTPEMTAVRLAVIAVSVAYAVLGSRLSERRLLTRYGEPYRRYLQGGVPFFVPRLKP